MDIAVDLKDREGEKQGMSYLKVADRIHRLTEPSDLPSRLSSFPKEAWD